MLTPAQNAELVLGNTKQSGDTGPDVRRIQEWLCLQGFSVQVDGIFGPATQSAVQSFQNNLPVPSDGIVTPDLFTKLAAPLAAAIAPIPPGALSLGAMVVAYAKQHLAQSPREVGGENCGPWVRFYMRGNQGTAWPWCAGFASCCIGLACDAIGMAPPMPYLFSCDLIAAAAQKNSSFVDGNDPNVAARVAPGALFLVRRPGGQDWEHTGIVVQPSDGSYSTIEGNSNDSGSAEGYEVVARTRGWSSKDYVMMP